MNLFYPNPSNDVIRFYEQGDYQIFDIDGRLVKSISDASIVNVSKMKQGIYFVKSSKGETRKLIIE